MHFCYDGKTSNGSACTGSAGSPNQGLLTGVGSSVSTTSYTYDARGRVTAGSQTTEGNTYNFAYAYNRDSSLDSITYPSGRVVEYTSYDEAGRVTSVAGTPSGGSAVNYATSMTYAPHGASLRRTQLLDLRVTGQKVIIERHFPIQQSVRQIAQRQPVLLPKTRSTDSEQDKHTLGRHPECVIGGWSQLESADPLTEVRNINMQASTGKRR